MSSFTGKSFKDYMASVKEKGQILDNSFGTDKKEIVNVEKTANDIIKEHLQNSGFQIENLIIEDKNIEIEFSSLKKEHEKQLIETFAKLNLMCENTVLNEFNFKASLKKK